MPSVIPPAELRQPNRFLERLRAGPVPVPAEGLSPEDKRGFGALNDQGLVRVAQRDGATFLELGKGKFYENATEAQQRTLDLVDARCRLFRDLEFRDASGSLSGSAAAHFTDFEIAPGVREIPLALLGPLLGGYDGEKESARIAALAADIRASGEIEPIFVGLDPEGELYIMEGQHRTRALLQLGYDAIPGRIVVDMDEPAPTARTAPVA